MFFVMFYISAAMVFLFFVMLYIFAAMVFLFFVMLFIFAAMVYMFFVMFYISATMVYLFFVMLFISGKNRPEAGVTSLVALQLKEPAGISIAEHLRHRRAILFCLEKFPRGRSRQAKCY
ncbi:MAG: hypothetical protein A2437_10590 [Bacteroidetes bacterium RIFOXYC2_FULL_40_12]|nr:MAG: hypothetical protein A2437_10590 [Bacteroidetes bacterium RIFOXYC2_FULL_40_12]